MRISSSSGKLYLDIDSRLETPMIALRPVLGALLCVVSLAACGCDSTARVPTPDEAAGTQPLTTPQNPETGSFTTPRVPNP